MKYMKHFRNFIIALAAGFVIFFSIGEQEASAADFTSNELRNTAVQYLGVPYSYGGTTSSGFDCSGFVRKVYSNLNISLPRTSVSMYNVGTSVKKSELIPGDLVFFNTSGRGISHVGIYYGNGKFIHSQTGKGVSLTSINDPWYWGDVYVGAKRVADVQLVSKK